MSGKLLVVSLALLAVVKIDAQLLCAVCNSANDLNCIFNPAAIAPQACPAIGTSNNEVHNSQCVTRLENNNLIRACGQGQTCTDPNTCQVCANTAVAANAPASGICNVGMLPNRRSCVQCHGHLTSTCASQQFDRNVFPCAGADQRCFTRRSDRLITRGCESQHRGLCQNEAQCLFCGTNGCNTLAQANPAIPEASSASLMTVAPTLVLGSLAMLWKAMY